MPVSSRVTDPFFDEFEEAFFKDCIRGQESDYLKERSLDIRSRHKKYRRTIHLQEPNVKESCGGLRDYHNLIWVIWVLQKSRNLLDIVEEGRLTHESHEDIEAAFEFLMRVRNDLHYSQKGSPSDVLTIRLQGIVATNFEYPGDNIIRQSEAFMRDYYRHTRNLFQFSTSLMQGFELEITGDDTGPVPIFNFLAKLSKTGRQGGKIRWIYFPKRPDFSGTRRHFRRGPQANDAVSFCTHRLDHLASSPEIRRLLQNEFVSG